MKRRDPVNTSAFNRGRLVAWPDFRAFPRTPAAAQTALASFWPLWRRPFRRDMGLFLLCFAYFVAATFVVSLANAYADRTNTNDLLGRGEAPYIVPDILQKPLSEFYTQRALPTHLPDTLVLVASLLILARGLTLQKWCLTLWRRFIITVGTLYLLRAITVSFTVIPTPFVTCKVTFDADLWYDAWLIFTQKRVACGDVFFSGHSLIFSHCLLIFWTTCRYWTLNVLVTLYCLWGMTSLLLAGYHYTIDVLIAFVLSALMWTLYHWMVWIPVLRQTHLGAALAWLDGGGLQDAGPAPAPALPLDARRVVPAVSEPHLETAPAAAASSDMVQVAIAPL